MILADTSIWIDHFRKPNKHFQELLIAENIFIHQFIIGELACGNFSNRFEILSLLMALPKTKILSNNEIIDFIETNHLYGKGLGLIDIHILGSALLSKVKLWTKDKRLENAAINLDCIHKI